MNHLNTEQRYCITSLLAQGKNQTEIAAIIGVNKSTICREIKRNSTPKGYDYKRADLLAQERHKHRRSYKLTLPIRQYIKQRLAQKDSPEQISIHIKQKFTIQISSESIYQYIYRDAQAGGWLYTHLRWASKTRRKRVNKRGRRTKIPNRVSIDQRPESANDYSEFGHWEADTIVGKNHKSFALTLVERQSKFTLIKHLADHSKDEVTKAFLSWTSRINLDFKSITADNGSEFSGHEEVTKQTDIPFYFADPHSPWQRGLNENTNGLIRQFVPKGTNINDYNLMAVQENLNNRIRKSLKFISPKQFLNQVAFET